MTKTKYRDFIDQHLAEGEDFVTGVTVRESTASALRYIVPFGRLESIMYLGLTTQRLFVVSNNVKGWDTIPLRSLRYGTDLSLGRDLMLRPTLTAKVEGQRLGKRYTFEHRHKDQAQRMCAALSHDGRLHPEA